MSTPVAALFDWKIGQVRSVALGETEQPIILVGTVHPRDAGDDFWRLDRLRADGLFADHGDQGKEYAAVAWVDPGQLARDDDRPSCRSPRSAGSG